MSKKKKKRKKEEETNEGGLHPPNFGHQGDSLEIQNADVCMPAMHQMSEKLLILGAIK